MVKRKHHESYQLPESSLHPSWLRNVSNTREDPEPEWLAKDNLETNPIIIKPETVSHLAEQSQAPLLKTSLALSACVSPWTIHLQVLDKNPLSSPGKGSLFLQQSCCFLATHAGDQEGVIVGSSRQFQWTPMNHAFASWKGLSDPSPEI